MIRDLLVTGTAYLILLLLQRIWHRDESRPSRLLGYGIITVSMALWFYYIHWYPDMRPGEWFMRLFEPLDPVP